MQYTYMGTALQLLVKKRPQKSSRILAVITIFMVIASTDDLGSRHIAEMQT